MSTYRDQNVIWDHLCAHRHRRDFLVLSEASRSIEICIRANNNALRFDAELDAAKYFDALTRPF